MNTNFERIRHIFLAIAEQPSAQWDTLLDQACGTDLELRQQVALLLRAHGEAAGILDQNVVGGASTAAYESLQEGPGTVIGPYKLLQQIGEGGFGVVFMAEQTQPVRRKVALKVLKPGMDTRQVVARFEAERQALAIMDHPNIAKVFDGGVVGQAFQPDPASPSQARKPDLPSGRPYFVMELVKGVPITEFCDQNQLTPRQRLELFIPVCQAVQHAHHKGIIHRDLKPSNILVTVHDTTPVPKVIDFGVAKALGQELTDKSLFTGLAQMIGTPLYMSPEQAGQSGLDIDTRSDIYSLGVLLYELLTGTTPFTKERFKQAAYEEMRRIIREEDPPKPSTRLSESKDTLPSISAQRHTEPAKLTKLVRGELDWIVMKALDKDRNRRYETANGFAADVQRYLNDEAVQACPPSMGYRFRKFARRNKRALAAAGVIGLALLLAVSAIGWAVRDRSAREEEAQRAQAARQVRVAGQVQQNLDEATRLERERKWPEALDAARRASDLLAGGEVDADIAGRVQDRIRDLELVRLLEDIRASKSEWKEGDFDYRGTGERYAAAFRDGGIDVERLTPEEAAQRLQSRSAVLAALSPALDDWAVCRLRAGDKVAAFQLWKVSGLVDPDPWRQKLRLPLGARDVKALRTLAAAPDLARQPAATLTDLSNELIWAGQVDVGIDVLYLAQRQHPADFWVHFWLGYAFGRKSPPNPEQTAACYRAALAVRPRSSASWTNLGNALAAQKKLDDAIACYKRAIEFNPKNAIAHGNLGKALAEQKKLDDAIACYRTAIQVDPKDASAHTRLGEALYDKGKSDEAIAEFRKTIELKPDYAFAHRGLGFVLHHLGKPDEAVAEYKVAIRLKPDYAEGHYGLALVLHDLGKPDDAVAEYKEAIRLKPDYAEAHYALGYELRNQGKPDEAIAEFREAIRLKPGYAAAHCGLGNALRAKRRLDEAIDELKEAIRLKPDFAEAHYSLGALLCDDKRDFDGAIALFRQAIRHKPDDPMPHFNLGHALFEKGNFDESIAAYREAIRLKPADAAVYHYALGNALVHKNCPTSDEAIAEFKEVIRLKTDHVEAHVALGNTLGNMGRREEAMAEFKEAIRLKPDHAGAHLGLGIALRGKGKLNEAIAEFKQAIRVKPDHAEAHFNLGVALLRPDKLAEAIDVFRKALALKPNYPEAYYHLGLALQSEGKEDEAIAAYRKTIALKPDYAEAHCNLGQNLRQKGQFGEALAALKNGHELGSKRPVWKHPSGQWVADCERLIELDGRLPAILKGETEPKDVSERIKLAQLCKLKRFHVAEAQFHRRVLAERRAWVGYRFEAIRAAALAGCGQGEDGAKLDEAERAGWRRQALDWLQGDLLLARKHLDSGTPQLRQAVQQILELWTTSRDLAVLRDAAALTKLPATERREWRKLWTDVEPLLRQPRKAQP